jgi:hypothetical protein
MNKEDTICIIWITGMTIVYIWSFFKLFSVTVDISVYSFCIFMLFFCIIAPIILMEAYWIGRFFLPPIRRREREDIVMSSHLGFRVYDKE